MNISLQIPHCQHIISRSHTSPGAIALPLALYGGGVGVIFLDDVDCLGNETRLEDCFYPGEIGESNCLHVEDASILCPCELHASIESSMEVMQDRPRIPPNV